MKSWRLTAGVCFSFLPLRGGIKWLLRVEDILILIEDQWEGGTEPAWDNPVIAKSFYKSLALESLMASVLRKRGVVESL